MRTRRSGRAKRHPTSGRVDVGYRFALSDFVYGINSQQGGNDMRKVRLSTLLITAVAIAFGTASAWAQSAVDRAVQAAKKYSGQTITIVWEAGLQSLDPLNFSGPKWEELTGI